MNSNEIIEITELLINFQLIEVDKANSFGKHYSYKLTETGNSKIQELATKRNLDQILKYLDKNKNYYLDLETVCNKIGISYNRKFNLILEKYFYIENKAKSKDGDGYCITDEGEYFLKIDGGNEKEFFDDFSQKIDEYFLLDLNGSTVNNMETSIELSSKIFFSHAKYDKELVNLIIDKLFLTAFEIDKSDLFYTSRRDMGVPNSKKWRDTIREKIRDCGVFIPIITESFKKSEMCLYELGGAWTLKKTIFPIILEPITFKDSGIIIEELQQSMINVSDDIKSLINDLNTKNENFKFLPLKKGAIIEELIKNYIISINNILQGKETAKKTKELSFEEKVRMNDIKPHFKLAGGQISQNEFKHSLLNEGERARILEVFNENSDEVYIQQFNSPFFVDKNNRFQITGHSSVNNARFSIKVIFTDRDENKYFQILTNDGGKNQLSDPEIVLN